MKAVRYTAAMPLRRFGRRAVSAPATGLGGSLCSPCVRPAAARYAAYGRRLCGLRPPYMRPTAARYAAAMPAAAMSVRDPARVRLDVYQESPSMAISWTLQAFCNSSNILPHLDLKSSTHASGTLSRTIALSPSRSAPAYAFHRL